MKTTRLIIGIISIVLSFIVSLQSCAAGLIGGIEQSGDTSGTGGIVVSLLMLISGITAICCRKSKSGSIVTGGFYILAALLGFASGGIFADLIAWSYLCLIFGAIFIVTGIKQKKN